MMKGIIINPRGCNASGKTTATREYIKKFPEAHLEQINGAWVTKCSDKVYVLGRYDKKNGGCDGYSGRDQVIQTIDAIIDGYNPSVIVYEGMLYSTSAKLAKDIDRMFRPKGYEYQGIYLYRKFSSIIRLLEARNGGADYNIASIYNTYRANENAFKAIEKAGLCIAKVDADWYPLEQMGEIIPQFIPLPD